MTSNTTDSVLRNYFLAAQSERDLLAAMREIVNLAGTGGTAAQAAEIARNAIAARKDRLSAANALAQQ